MRWLAAATVAAALAAGGASAGVPGIPEIYVTYSQDCTFALSVDGGITVTSSTAPGPTLPPGQYQIVVRMPNPVAGYAPCTAPAFTLAGPGVTSRTQFRGEELTDEHL
jgi:hypothetical protein